MPHDTIGIEWEMSAPALQEEAAFEQPPAQQQDDVLLNLMVLEPGDHELLAQMIRNYPHLREQILERASADLGNDTVAKALQTLAGIPEPEAPSEKAASEAPSPAVQADTAQEPEFDYTTSPLALEYDEEAKIKDHADFMRANPQVADQVLTQAAELDPNLAVLSLLELETPMIASAEQSEETPQQVVEETSKAAAEDIAAEQQTTAPAPVTAEEAVQEAAPVVEPEKESGWVARAREFNTEHADEVARFLAATGGACLVEGMLDPNLVAQWQAAHGIEVDGRVGPGTADAAVKAQAETAEKPAAEQQEQQDEEYDPTDPNRALM